MPRLIDTINRIFQMAAKCSAVEDWHEFGTFPMSSYKEGDIIEFWRLTIPPYYHFGMIVDTGKVVHFNPTAMTEKVGLQNMEVFFDGSVTIDKLQRVAGTNSYRVKTFDNPDLKERPIEDIRNLVEICKGSSVFKYCLEHFNCEHFIMFIKYGKAVSYQIQNLIKFKKDAKRVFHESLIIGFPVEARLKVRMRYIFEDFVEWGLSHFKPQVTIPISTNNDERRIELERSCKDFSAKLQGFPSWEDMRKNSKWKCGNIEVEMVEHESHCTIKLAENQRDT